MPATSPTPFAQPKPPRLSGRVGKSSWYPGKFIFSNSLIQRSVAGVLFQEFSHNTAWIEKVALRAGKVNSHRYELAHGAIKHAIESLSGLVARQKEAVTTKLEKSMLRELEQLHLSFAPLDIKVYAQNEYLFLSELERADQFLFIIEGAVTRKALEESTLREAEAKIRREIKAIHRCSQRAQSGFLRAFSSPTAV
jgi:hypothetical protein